MADETHQTHPVNAEPGDPNRVMEDTYPASIQAEKDRLTALQAHRVPNYEDPDELRSVENGGMLSQDVLTSPDLRDNTDADYVPPRHSEDGTWTTP